MQHSSCSSSSFSAGHARAFRFRLDEGVEPTPAVAALIGDASLLEADGAGDAIKAAMMDEGTAHGALPTGSNVRMTNVP
mgnify:CR=1 FL=1